jgi:hypothetical protein
MVRGWSRHGHVICALPIIAPRLAIWENCDRSREFDEASGFDDSLDSIGSLDDKFS